jgi:fluoroacetyl-CoA thioesterase
MAGVNAYFNLPITNCKLPMKTVPIGARGEAEQTVAFEHTLEAHNPRLPKVYSTPHMIGLMETAGFYALEPYCEGDEITVGTHIDIEHRAPSTIGARVQAEAVVESFDGKFYTIKVVARELSPHPKEIGSGIIQRATVSVGKFLQKFGQSASPAQA